MVKIIRISIAGIQSTGKSFFIGGIKSAFMGNNIMDNMQYDILNNLKNNYFESILEIEHDIEDSYVKNNGTTGFHAYLCDIFDSSSKIKIKLAIANIPGEVYTNFYEGSTNFIGYHTSFEELIQQNKKAKKLLKKIKSISVRPDWLEWLHSKLPEQLKNLTSSNFNNLEKNEDKLFELFVEHLKVNYSRTYLTVISIDPNTKKMRADFKAYVFSYLADQTYLCIDPNPSKEKQSQQNKLLSNFCGNIITNKNFKSDLNFVITKFDSLFVNPNQSYLPNRMNCKEDYFIHTDKWLNVISEILAVRKPKTLLDKKNIDKLTNYINLIYTSNKLKTVRVDGENFPKNLFLTCITNTNQLDQRIPEILDISTFPMNRFPIGCYEIVYSMLLKTEKIQFSQLGLDNFENYKFVKAYLN